MPLLLLLFVLVPIVEIYVIIQVGQEIGALWTVIILIVDSIVGARLLSWQGRAAWRAFQDALAAGKMPHQEILDGVLIVVGGTLLLTPGFITDVFGLLLLLPPTRALIRRAIVRSIRRRGAVTRVVFYSPQRARPTPRPPTPEDPGGTGPERQLPKP